MTTSTRPLRHGPSWRLPIPAWLRSVLGDAEAGTVCRGWSLDCTAHRSLTVLVAATLLVAAFAPWVLPLARRSGGPVAAVIVRALPGTNAQVERLLGTLGGSVRAGLPLIHGFAATVPSDALARLSAFPGVVSVSPDRAIRPLAATYDTPDDPYAMHATTLSMGAQSYWQAGFTGRGVDVALVDSGVAPVDGLAIPGKLINGADLSFESQAANLAYLDTYGHGTHMAGIIAGRASSATPSAYVGDSTDYLGVAPDARIVSVKVADANGVTDVSQVIAAIDWVVQHKTDNGLNIRVLNLSYGTDTTQTYTQDPLAYAAEQAWKAGIFVVAATGNAGFVQKTGTMMSPAYDPLLMAVGATDTMGTTTLSDDTVPAFSSSGSNVRRPDIVAPGTHVVSLRDPGSYIDQTYGSSGDVNDGLFRGSGTSQAAAVTSGAAALIIQQRPGITPSQLKKLLSNTASSLSGTSSASQGHGELNLASALSAPTPPEPVGPQASSGGGSLDLSRGTFHLVMNGVTLSGEQDIFGAAFSASPMARAEASGSSWSGGTWNGNSWSGTSWSGNSWSTTTWSGNSWSGASWSSCTWSGNSWSGNSWSGTGWSGNSWSGNSWSGNSWSSSYWADADWS